jgi:hypothetical protein
VSGESHPAIDGSFFFTDYSVRVGRVFRQPSGRQTRPGDSVVVGAPNGSMVIGGVTVSSTTTSDPLLTWGATYLVFAN